MPGGGWLLLDKILQVSSNYHYCNCNFYGTLTWASGAAMRSGGGMWGQEAGLFYFILDFGCN